jgi:hypothetical protein
MRKLLIIALTFASINVAAGQVWAQYDFQVESAEAQAKIIAASNELMSSDFAKENLKGSVHLDAYISMAVVLLHILLLFFNQVWPLIKIG